MRKYLAAAIVGLGLSTSAFAGDFSTSGVTYQTTDFTAAGGALSVSGSDSIFVRFPLVDGAEYTVSWESTNGRGYGLAVHDFVVADGTSGDPFPSTGVLASNRSFSTTGSSTFTASSNGFGTIELTDFFSSPVAATLRLTTNISAVPLPAAGLLLVGGIAALGMTRRRRKTQASA